MNIPYLSVRPSVRSGAYVRYFRGLEGAAEAATEYSTSTVLYGNMVDFSFIVSLYVSDLPNVTIGTVLLVRVRGCAAVRAPSRAARRRGLFSPRFP